MYDILPIKCDMTVKFLCSDTWLYCDFKCIEAWFESDTGFKTLAESQINLISFKSVSAKDLVFTGQMV